jgi:hypothetical protein
MTPIDDDKIIEVMAWPIFQARAKENGWDYEPTRTDFDRHYEAWQENRADPLIGDSLMIAHCFKNARAVLTALSSSGYIICQASDAAGGEAVSPSALQSTDSAEAYVAKHIYFAIAAEHATMMAFLGYRANGDPIKEPKEGGGVSILTISAAGDNLDAAIYDLKRTGADKVSIRTCERVHAQIRCLAEYVRCRAEHISAATSQRQLEEPQADTEGAVGWFNHEKDLIPISVDLGEHGLYYGTSKAVKGLLVIGNTVQEVIDRVPQALAELQQARREIEEAK